jgi:hypothetical protein
MHDVNTCKGYCQAIVNLIGEIPNFIQKSMKSQEIIFSGLTHHLTFFPLYFMVVVCAAGDSSSEDNDFQEPKHFKVKKSKTTKRK